MMTSLIYLLWVITLKFINIKDRVLNIIQGNIIEQELKSLSTIGDRLIYLRKRKKLTRKALAPLLGIEYNVLHKYETNKYKPNAVKFCNLSLSSIFLVALSEAQSIITLKIFHLPKKSNKGLMNFTIKYTGMIFPIKLQTNASM